MRSIPLALLVVVGCSALSAQVAPGHRLYSPLGVNTSTYLVDDAGVVVHTWRTTYPVGVSAYLRPNGNLLRTIRTAPGAAGAGGGIQEVALDGTLVWDYRHTFAGVRAHHDIEILPNGNILLIAWVDKTPAEARAAGRDPQALGSVFQPDMIAEIKRTGPTSGAIVWEWHVWDHLIQDLDPNAANYGNVGAHPELIDINFPPRELAPIDPIGPPAAPPPPPTDFNHFNSVSYDPIHDWVIISAHSQSEIWIIDHSTTTAEAAGHTGGRYGKGGDLLYRWGNPRSYRAGSVADQKLFFQHSAKRVPPGYPGAGNITVFNNQIDPASEVWELVLPIDAAGNFSRGAGGAYGPAGPVWRYAAPGFHSAFMSSCERLPNGNTLICSSLQGRAFEVSPAGQVVWQIAPGITFNVTHVRTSLWASADEVSAVDGGRVTFDLIPGTRHAGQPYFLAGSMSGTSPGFRLGGYITPLNVDPYLLNTMGTGLLPGSVGIVGTSGRATAAFELPSGIAAELAGLRLHHAFLVVDPSTLAVTHMSNPVPLQLR